MFVRKFLGLVILFGVLSGGVVLAGPQFSIALEGYDTVSYFDGGAPAKGKFEHAVFGTARPGCS
jgi:hypothetical protein